LSSTQTPVSPQTSGTRPPSTKWPSASGRPAKAKRAFRRRAVALATLMVVVLGSVYLGWSRWGASDLEEDTQLYTVSRRGFSVILEEQGELEAVNSIDIRCELEGRSTIIYLIDEGTQVKRGELLVELASDLIDENIRDEEINEATAEAAYEAAVKEDEILKDEDASNIRKAELALRLAELALEKYQQGEKAELEQNATLAVEKSKSVLARTTEDLKDSQELYEQGFITKIELEDDRFDKYEASIEVKTAALAQQVLTKYTIPMALEEKTSDVEEAKKELERTRKASQASEAKSQADVTSKKSQLDLIREKLTKLRDQKQKAKITAPADGLVVYARSERWWRSEDQIEVGAQVHERQSLIELPDTGSMKVVVNVHEAQTEHLKPGLPATVEIEGFTGQQFTGTVSKIAVMADSSNRWLNPNLKEYQTDILLDGDFTELKPGITTHAKIFMAELENVLTVPVQAVFAQGGKYYVFLNDGKTTRPVEVAIGLASNEYVEIKKGLTVDQRICLAVTDDMKLALPEESREKPSTPPAETAPKNKLKGKTRAKK